MSDDTAPGRDPERAPDTMKTEQTLGKTPLQTARGAEEARVVSVPEEEGSQDPSAPALPGYRLSRMIGRGAYASVWRAWQERTHKWVAVKVFHQTGALNWLLLQREVERLTRLDKHPFIVSLLDADLLGKKPYYVLDLIEGGSLERFVKRTERRSTEEVAKLMEQVAEALAYVHAKGIIHCDLKPANIMMDEEGRPRVADFGQSRVFSDSSAALGTLFYMAPEQAISTFEGQRVSPDVRWDIYALGATFYSLLTGELPHASSTRDRLSDGMPIGEKLRGYREAVFADARIRIRDADVDEDLAAIIEKCLDPDPAGRYATVPDILRDLQRRRERRPVSPLAASGTYRTRKFLQRNRLLVAVSAAATIALVVAGVRLVNSRANLRRQLALSFLAQSQLEFLKGNPLRAIAYGAHSNELAPTHLAKTSTLWYLTETAAPRLVYPGEGPAAFSPDGRLVAASDPAFGAEIREVRTARLVAGPLRTQGDILSIVFSSDGRILAAGTRDKEIRIWDSATGRPLFNSLEHESAVTSLAISRDSRWLAAGGSDGGVRLWNMSSGRRTGSTSMRHGNRVTAAEFSPDGGALLTASEQDDTATLWRIPSGEPIAVIRLSERVHGVAFSPDGRMLATAGGDRTIRLWDTRDGKLIGKAMPQKSHALAIAFSPDGRRLIAGGWDSQAQIWDTATQEPIGHPMSSGGDVTSVAFSPNGKLVATGSADTTAQVWDAGTQEPYGRLLEHPTAVRGVGFLPDSSGLLTLSVGGSARWWPIEPVPVLGRTLPHDSGVWDAAFSPDGLKIVTGSKDEKGRIWDSATGRLLQVLPHEARVRVVRFSPDGKTILTGSWKGRVRLWDAFDGSLLAEAAHGENVFAASFSGDGRSVLSAGIDGLVRLWRLPGLQPLPFTIIHPGQLTAAMFSPDGKLVLTTGQDNTARMWDAATGRPVGKPMTHADDVSCAAFSPDGRLLLTGSSDLTARLWRVPSGDAVPGILMRHKDGVKAVAFSPDGRKMVTAGLDQRMRLWDTKTGRGLGPLMSHAGIILAVAFSPDGKTLLSAGVEHLARLWDVETSIPIRSFRHADAVIVANFSPDGSRVLTASSDGTAHVWETPWLVRDISPSELKRLSDRATIKEIDDKGDMVTISQEEWEDDFLKHPPQEP